MKHPTSLLHIIALVGFLLNVWAPSQSTAAECNQTFSWLPNSETELAGYKIYYGTSDGGPYGSIVDVGNPALVDGRVYGEVTGLTCGVNYFFVCVAYDSQDEESDYSQQVSVTALEPGTYVTAIFGSSSDTDYPGTLEDTFINLNEENNISSVALNTYTWPDNKVANAIIIKADLTQLDTGAQIQSAILQLYVVETGGDSSYDISAHKIINFNPELSGATGFTYDGSNAWTANDSCYDNVPLAQADIESAESTVSLNTSLGYKSLDISGMVQEWVNNPSSNYGILVNSDSVASSNSYRFFASSEASDTTQRPKLIINYTPGEPAPVIMNISVQ